MKLTSRQLCIIHLSDIHFGEPHRFSPGVAPDGTSLQKDGVLTLLDSLHKDWQSMGRIADKVIVTITGDITQKAISEEFDLAKQLLEGLIQKPILGCNVTKNEIFIVPGNHDVVYDEPNKERRWEPFCSFYRNFFRDTNGRDNIYSDSPEKLSRVHDRSTDLGIVVIELNSCVYIVKDSPEAQRGQIGPDAIQNVRDQLENIPEDCLKQSIRIALVHHHPILIPAFAERKRGYDAILNADQLLTLLRDFGFHIVLHGHKHYPQTFSYDTTCSWTTDDVNPVMIVAGGSAGSDALPTDEANAQNTYNLISVKWNWKGNEGRVRVSTKGLSFSDEHGRKALYKYWKWSNLRTVDQLLRPRLREAETNVRHIPSDTGPDNKYHSHRTDMYNSLRGNMPVVEVIPSLKPSQEYEARVRIVRHTPKQNHMFDNPVEVVWYAGTYFPDMAQCFYVENPDFGATFGFYGPMLIQARIKFSDGTESLGYVYASMP
jgi:3',5'-cyclic AMP phosphodiesterase CpdA